MPERHKKASMLRNEEYIHLTKTERVKKDEGVIEVDTLFFSL